MSVLRTILRHNAPTGEPLSPGNGGSAPAHEPVSEPELVPPLTRLSGLTCGIAPWGAESGTYCSDTLRDTQKPDYLISFSSPSGSEPSAAGPVRAFLAALPIDTAATRSGTIGRVLAPWLVRLDTV